MLSGETSPKERKRKAANERDEKQTQGKTGRQESSSREIEEKNRMGRTRDLFKKIRDTKRIFHAN